MPIGKVFPRLSGDLFVELVGESLWGASITTDRPLEGMGPGSGVPSVSCSNASVFSLKAIASETAKQAYETVTILLHV